MFNVDLFSDVAGAVAVLIGAVAAALALRAKTTAETRKILAETAKITGMIEDTSSDVSAVKHQVKNTHRTNLREDMDVFARRQEEQSDEIRRHQETLDSMRADSLSWRNSMSGKMNRIEETVNTMAGQFEETRSLLERIMELNDLRNKDKEARLKQLELDCGELWKQKQDKKERE